MMKRSACLVGYPYQSWRPAMRKVRLMPFSDSGHLCAVKCQPTGALEPIMRTSTPPPASLRKQWETEPELPALRLAPLHAGPGYYL